MSNQPNLLQLAKQGEPRAIAALMNHYFQLRGVTVRAALRNDCLQIMLKITQALPQQLLMAAVRKATTSLKSTAFGRVEVYGWQKEGDFPSWIEGFELAKKTDLFLTQPIVSSTISDNKKQKAQEKIKFLQAGLHKIAEVIDGDSMRINYGNESLNVRLAYVDAPESGQPSGENAAIRLRQLVSEQSVKLQVIEFDCYERFVSKVFRGEEFINLRMVREGHAVAYTQYLKNTTDDIFQKFSEAEAQARLRKIEFWSQANPEMPWVYRARTTPERQRTTPKKLPPILRCRDSSIQESECAA